MPHRHDETSDAPRQGLRANGAASAAELREFLARVHGRPPQEVLGLVAQSGLARAMILSTLITLAAMVALTAVPFAITRATGGATAAASKGAPDKQGGDQAASTQAGAKTEAPSTAEAPKTSPASSQEAALSKLGIGETKTAPKNVNPLENRADDILKGFDK